MSDLHVKVINGAAAGVLGVATTFPLDLVKTNLQLHPTSYQGIRDCFRKIYSSGGLVSFYRGIKPNLLLISPEKAIKLSCNDIFRKQLLGNRKRLPLVYECIAGGGAGLCQGVITTPMELLKIRGQARLAVAASLTNTAAPSANLNSKPNQSSYANVKQTSNLSTKVESGASQKPSESTIFKECVKIVKNEGFRGIYKGAGPTLLRDIPFSMCYFPMFAHLNHANLNADGTSKPLWSLVSGVGAGAFSAWIVTPLDYVKTQIQSPTAKEGLKIHTLIVDTISKQGPRGLFTGALPRVMVVAPLFGVAQATYYIGLGERILGRQDWDKPI